MALGKGSLPLFPPVLQILVINRLLLLANCNGTLNPGNVLHLLLGLSHTGTGLVGFLLHMRQNSVQLLQSCDLVILEIDNSPCHILQILYVTLLLTGPGPIAPFCFSLIQIIIEKDSELCGS